MEQYAEKFTRFYTTYLPLAKRMMRSFGCDEDTAKDLIQDFFMALWNDPAKLDTIQHPETYISRSLRNRAYDYAKTKERRAATEMMTTWHCHNEFEYRYLNRE